MGLARGIILVPNNRAARAISDAFVRRADGLGGKGLLLPRMVPVGDIDLDERLGNALDPIGTGADIPPAIDPMARQMILARMVQDARTRAGMPVDAGEAMRLGLALGATLDQLLVEQVSPQALTELPIAVELSHHWQKSLALFMLLLDQWPQELARRGVIDAADRRNRLLAHVASRWRDKPPAGFVVAAGITTTAPAIAHLLRTVAMMEQGQVVLPDLDLHMASEDWAAIGPFEPHPDSGIRPRAVETHPQFALKLLLDRMGVNRDEVALWRWGGGHDARAARSRNISNAMLPALQTTKWQELKTGDRSLAGVRAIEAATPAEEAQAIALALRETLETPEKTAALVTPDRALATRVSAHLRRWGIEADDSAGRPLSQLPPGTLIVAMADMAAERFAPVPLLAVLKHPLVMQGEGRLGWLENVRALDLLLRGPRPPAGLQGIDALLAKDDSRRAWLRQKLVPWWPQARALLEPLEQAFEAGGTLPRLLAAIRETASALTCESVWAGHQGHAAARLFAEMEAQAHEGPGDVQPASLAFLLDQMLAGVAVRPPQGGHPRIAILGLLEARLQQADLMILSGLNEGTWPALPSPDPWLAPKIRQELGLPSLERRIGLSAHDLANGLGAPEVLITRSRRDASAPAIASRFWLRLKAMAGPQWKADHRYTQMALRIDDPGQYAPARRPAPNPALSVRPRDIAVTDVDRLKADPFAFYARKILALSQLDMVDADPTPAWRGTEVHAVLEAWFKQDEAHPDALAERAMTMLAGARAHPLMRAFWQPRLLQALQWVARAVAEDRLDGRTIALVEQEGKAEVAGVLLRGTADRIDHMADGSIAIVDYKTGKPPSAAMVANGFSMQLGLLGLIAERGGFARLNGPVRTSAFEYWSMGKDKYGSLGYRMSPVDPAGAKGKLATDAFTAESESQFRDAVERWLTGHEPFIAKLHPEYSKYNEFDQLMRLDEWYGRNSDRSSDA